MKKFLFVITLILSLNSCKYVDKSKFIGTWHFVSFVNEGKDQLRSHKIQLEFDDDGFFSMAWDSKDKKMGKWSLLGDNEISLIQINNPDNPFIGSYSFNSGLLTIKGGVDKEYVVWILTKEL